MLCELYRNPGCLARFAPAIWHCQPSILRARRPSAASRAHFPIVIWIHRQAPAFECRQLPVSPFACSGPLSASAPQGRCLLPEGSYQAGESPSMPTLVAGTACPQPGVTARGDARYRGSDGVMLGSRAAVRLLSRSGQLRAALAGNRSALAGNRWPRASLRRCHVRAAQGCFLTVSSLLHWPAPGCAGRAS